MEKPIETPENAAAARKTRSSEEIQVSRAADASRTAEAAEAETGETIPVSSDETAADGVTAWDVLARGFGEDKRTRWVNECVLADEVVCRARAVAAAWAPRVWQKLRELIEEGSVSAIRLFFELLRQGQSSASSSAAAMAPEADSEVRALRRAIFTEHAG